MSSQTLPLSGERIVVVDVLRAFALFGIIITHAVDGFLAGPAPSPDFMLYSPLLARFSLGPVVWLWRSLTYSH